jgi:hypothetical protein
MENQRLVSPSRQCSSTPVDFGIKNFLAKNNETTLEHPPYSPNLGPADLPVPSTEISIEGTALF